MASLQQRSGWFHLQFRYAGKQFSHALKTRDRREAEAQRGIVDRLLMRIRNKEFPQPPASVEVAEYLLSGGKIPDVDSPVKKELTAKELSDQYIEAHSNGALEENSLTTIRLHLKHITQSLGDPFLVRDVTTKVLQRYLDSRSRMKGKKQKKLSPETLKKEIASLRAAWNWAVRGEMMEGTFAAYFRANASATNRHSFTRNARSSRRPSRLRPVTSRTRVNGTVREKYGWTKPTMVFDAGSNTFSFGRAVNAGMAVNALRMAVFCTCGGAGGVAKSLASSKGWSSIV